MHDDLALTMVNHVPSHDGLLNRAVLLPSPSLDQSDLVAITMVSWCGESEH